MSRGDGPAFTVVIPAFDRAATIGAAIESVLAQSHEAFRLVVVDDGSTDSTAAVVAGYTDPRVCYVHQDNAGVCAARNRGVAESSEPYVTFLDSDDVARPGWLAGFAAGFADGASLVTSGAAFHEHDGTVRDELPRGLSAAYGNLTALYLAGCFALERSLFEAVGGYAPGLRFSENTELGLRLGTLALEGKVRVAVAPGIGVDLIRRAPERDAQRRYESACYLLEACGRELGRDPDDGVCTVAELIATLRARYAVDEAVMTRDVHDALAALTSAGAIEDVTVTAEIAVVAGAQPAAPATQVHADWWPTVGPFRALDATFVVHGDDVELIRIVNRVFASLADRLPGDAEHAYAIVASADGYRLYADAVEIGRDLRAEQALAALCAHVNRLAAGSARRCVCLHAAAVEVCGTVVVLPAVSESGKSTLVASLTGEGGRYLSDELAALDATTGAVRPFPKAITLADAALALFDDVSPIVGVDGGDWQVDPLELGAIGTGGPVGLVVSPRWVPGAATRLQRLVGLDALRLLLDNSVDFDHLGAPGFAVLAALAADVPCYRLTYSSLAEAGEVIRQRARRV